MESLIAFASIILILFIGISLYQVAVLITELMTGRKVTPKLLFKDFDQKMWMTAGLGILFFGLYLIVMYLMSTVVNAEVRVNLFYMLYENKTTFIYLGLFTFAGISTCIYLARMFIKYLYKIR